MRRIYAVRHANDDATITTVARMLRDKDTARELVARYVAGEHVKVKRRTVYCLRPVQR